MDLLTAADDGYGNCRAFVVGTGENEHETSEDGRKAAGDGIQTADEEMSFPVSRARLLCCRDLLLGGSVPVFSMFTEDDPVSSIVAHPAFRRFGVQLLPKPEYATCPLPLRYVGDLMPWHNHVRGDIVVAALNVMIEQVQAGIPLFYPFYSDDRKYETGLFFFRGRKKAPFAVICPGGGFSYVGSLHEGFPLACTLSRQGYNAFVLNYRTGSGTVACHDLAHALTYIFARADALCLTRHGYSLWGGSAGARMVAHVGSLGARAYEGAEFPKPAAVVMCYTSHATYTRTDPPTIAFVGTDDTIASPMVMERRIRALQNEGIDAEFILYPSVRHGFGLGVGTSAAGWTDIARAFWEKERRKQCTKR